MTDDPRKTAALARAAIHPGAGTHFVGDFATARRILRDPAVVQAGAGAAVIDKARPEEVSLFYLDGAAHRRRRATIAPYFTPKAIETRYAPIMAEAADRLISRLAATGGGALDVAAFRFAVAVAAEVIGLDAGDLDGLADRIAATISTDGRKPVKDTDDVALQAFYRCDVYPAIAARKVRRREDVISRLLDEGMSDTFIRTEVRGYSIAGMVTTREFIVMAAWYLFERPPLMAAFRAGDAAAQLAMLEEILRLEPVIGFLRRQVAEETDVPGCGRVAAGGVVAIDIRAANCDERVAGACPHAFDAARAGTVSAGGGMSFGDGPHRCPGAQLALHEARIFLDRLVRVPGLRLAQAPSATWFRPISSYELSGATVIID